MTTLKMPPPSSFPTIPHPANGIQTLNNSNFTNLASNLKREQNLTHLPKNISKALSLA